jgi:hypothetical protein
LQARIPNLTTDLTDHTDKKKIFNHEKHEKHEKEEREKRTRILFSCPFVFFVVIFLRGVRGYPKLRIPGGIPLFFVIY